MLLKLENMHDARKMQDAGYARCKLLKLLVKMQVGAAAEQPRGDIISPL